MKHIVIATFTVVGFHAWLEAPEQVEYLASRHRHLFKFKVEAVVTKTNRQVEFHQLMAAALDVIYRRWGCREGGDGREFGNASCEMIGEDVLRRMRQHDWPVTAVEVWEDEEHGARVEWEREDAVQEAIDRSNRP